MIKWILRSLIIFVLVIMTLLTTALMLVSTHSGTKISLNIVKHFVPGKLSYDSVHGKLSEQIQLSNVHYQINGTTFDIAKLNLQWRPWALLMNKIVTSDLSANGIKITRGQLSTPTTLNVQLSTTGTIQHYTAHLSVRDQYTHWQGTVVGDQNKLTINTQDASLLNGKFNINGTLDQNMDLKWVLKNIPIKQWLPGAQGELSGSGTLTGPLNKPMLQATFNALKLKWQDLTLPAVKTDISLRYDFTAISPINGQLVCKLNDISFLQALLPKVDNVQGQLNTKISITGTLANPTITGLAKVENGKFSVPDTQAQARDFTLSARATGNKIHFNGSTKVGKGQLNIEGNTDLSNPNFNTHFKVTGNNAQLINMSQTKILASPDLTMDLNTQGLTIKGTINIPYGQIKSYELGDTESLPDDVVIIDPSKKIIEESEFDVTSLVSIKLGDHINIDMEGLKGRVTGKITIKDEPQKPTTAVGQLQIADGSFEIYGIQFIIDKGKLSYHGGPISNPGLNIRAIRKINQSVTGTNQLGADDTTVGILITGTANHPKYTLFSSPGGYSQADILSYLFTGQPLASLQGDENKAQLLMQAAALVNIGGGGKINGLRNEIKSTLGLSELDIQTTSEVDKRANRTIQHTALVLGKYLSPKLYIRYSFDVLDHTNKLNIRYFLNKNWSIQTESSNSSNSTNLDNGVDVLYTIERN